MSGEHNFRLSRHMKKETLAMKNPYKELSKYTAKRLEALEAFGLGPRLKLSGFERDIIDVIEQLEEPGFYDLCECFDLKPSKMEKELIRLEEKGLVVYMDAAGKVYLTDIAERYILNLKKESKSEKKLRAFIESLNDEETEEFLRLCDEFKIEYGEEEEADDTEAEAEEAEDEDADANVSEAQDNGEIRIVDTTEAEFDEPEAEESVNTEAAPDGEAAQPEVETETAEENKTQD